MGKLTRKDIKLQVKAIMESKSLTEAYKKTHNCSDATANAHASDMLKRPEVVAELEKQLEAMRPVEVNKNNLIKLLTMVVSNWQSGKERTSDFLKAIELLSRLVPEFSDKRDINIYQNMTDEQLDQEIKTKFKQLGMQSGEL